MDDFSSYSNEIIDQLAGAQACIWVLGGPAFRYPDYTTAKTVNVDYVESAAMTFATALASRLPKSQKFHFVYVSGQSVARDQTKKLWMFEDSRKIKGLVENRLVEIQENHPETFASYLLRPGSVLLQGMAWKIAGALTRPIQDSVGVEAMAAVLIDVAMEGWESQVMENDVLKARGQALLLK
ncbi:uncharacterized protein N7459_007177 [Penicillium hispanicum]|uniref:uncharacterized protein n=1 Tax=Penicillium hispanicum TaxID=1080232 RepID=UPI0025407045|nr:uncharacterized protein N7459_007177 [Penicillium hispanicum]KAJ5578213.1 hypothetical protein N7459_007177 [Penicillium hispanicum]